MVPTTAEAAAGSRRVTLTPWVVFVCGGERYGLPLESVTEILSPLPYTRLPGAPAETMGLAGIRGAIVTVFDLGLVLGRGSSGAQPDHRVLVLEAGGRRAAAAVDEVRAVRRAQPEPGEVPGPGLWGGRARDDDGTFLLLKPESLLEGMLQG